MQEFKRLINSKITNIWRYTPFYPPIEEKYRLTNNEGWTNFEKIEGIYFKREDQNPTGSVKDRGMAYQISAAYKRGDAHLVLSSSGNAAISATVYCRLAGVKLSVFVSPRINKNKLKRLKSLNIDLHISENPVREAALFRKKQGIRNIRQSLDPAAVPGYMSLGFEIFEAFGEAVSIFLPVSSGTTLVGIGRAFLKLKRLPQLHAVQTVFVNPIASEFHQDFIPYRTTKESFRPGLAASICAPKTARKDEVLKLIRASKGSGWIVTDEEIRNSLNWLKGNGIETSPEGGAALAAVFKARKEMELGTVICILTGRKY